MTVRVGTATDLGLRRTQNEDRHGVWMPDPDEARERGVLLVVADGMGGALAGEVASQLAVDCVLREYREAGGDVAKGLRHSIEVANRVIHEHSAAYPELRGMGTTCTAIVLRNGEAFFAHVGDSRAYRVRDGAIRQLTEDHSLVAQLVLHHHLTPEQARVDPRRNVVTRSVGVGAEVDVDSGWIEEPFVPGDTVVLCTDGLHGLVEDSEIAKIASQPDVERACSDLVELANDRGGHDNITVVIARLES
jgi:serine/threonine protein phosphatase PrpC